MVPVPGSWNLSSVVYGGLKKFILKELPSWTRIGRWSESRVVMERHSESIDMWSEVGKRLAPVEWRYVGKSVTDSVIWRPFGRRHVYLTFERTSKLIISKL